MILKDSYLYTNRDKYNIELGSETFRSYTNWNSYNNNYQLRLNRYEILKNICRDNIVI